MRPAAAVCQQHRPDRVFVKLFAAREPLLQFGKKAAQGNAVLPHGFADVRNLGRRFFSFETGRRVGTFNRFHIFRQPRQCGHGNLGGIQHQAA